MAKLVKLLAVIAVVVAVAAEVVVGQPACVANLIPCENSLNATKPAADCCSSLKEAVEKDLPCLCSLFNDKDLFKAFNINITQALELPKHCGISQGVEACKAGTALAPAPAPTFGGNSIAPGSSQPQNKGARVGLATFSGLLTVLMLWATVGLHA